MLCSGGWLIVLHDNEIKAWGMYIMEHSEVLKYSRIFISNPEFKSYSGITC